MGEREVGFTEKRPFELSTFRMSKNFKSQKNMYLLKLTRNSSPLGIISFLNYVTFRSPSLDPNVTVIPKESSRLGIGPVTTVASAEDEGPMSETKSSSDREEKLPNVELPNADLPNAEM